MPAVKRNSCVYSISHLPQHNLCDPGNHLSHCPTRCAWQPGCMNDLPGLRQDSVSRWEAAALTASSRGVEHQDGRARQDAVAESGLLLSKSRAFSNSAALGQLELNRRHCLHHGTAMFPRSGGVHWDGYIWKRKRKLLSAAVGSWWRCGGKSEVQMMLRCFGV